MKIDRLKFHGFGRYVDQEFFFHKGINLIEAPNEAGKTTMIYGLLGLLYGGKKEGYRIRRAQEWVRHYTPWKATDYGGEVDYEIDGKKYRLIRDLLPSKEKEQIIDLDTGKDLSSQFPMDKKRERYVLERQLGISGETYKRIGYFHAGSLITAPSKKETEKRNRQLVEHMTKLLKQGAEYDVTPVVEQLEKGIESIGKTDQAKNKPYGILVEKKKKLEQEIADLLQRKKWFDQEEKKFAEALEEKERLLEQLEQVEGKMEACELQLEREREFALSYEQYEKILNQEIAIKRNYQKLEIIREELASLKQELEKRKQLPISEEELKELQVCMERQQRLQVEKKNLIEQLNLTQLEKEATYQKELPAEESEINWHLAKLSEYEELEHRFRKEGEPKHIEKRAALQRMDNEYLQYQQLEKKESMLYEKRDQIEKEVKLVPEPQKNNLDKILWSLTGVWVLFSIVTAFFSWWFAAAGVVFSAICAWFAKVQMDRERHRNRKLKMKRNKFGLNLEIIARELEKVKQKKAHMLQMWKVKSLEEFFAKRNEYQSLLAKEENTHREWEFLQKQMKQIEQEVGNWLSKYVPKLPDFNITHWRQLIYRIRKQQVIYKEQIYKLDVQLLSTQKEIDRVSQELDSIREFIQRIQEKIGADEISDLENWLQIIGESQETEWKIKEVEKQLQQLEMAEVEESWQQNLIELTIQRDQIITRWQGEIRELGKVWDGETLSDFKQKRDEIIGLLQKLEKEIGRVEAALDEREEIICKLSKLESEREKITDEIKELELEKLAMELAKDVLEESAKEIQEDLSPRLTPVASRWVERITEGRYKKIWIDPTDQMRLSVFTPETGNREVAEALSTGTMDQMYLALRVSLVQFYSEETKHHLPMILDDCFVHFDNRRLEKTLSLLGELAERHQIIICTCQSRERKMLEKQKIPFQSIKLDRAADVPVS